MCSYTTEQAKSLLRNCWKKYLEALPILSVMWYIRWHKGTIKRWRRDFTSLIWSWGVPLINLLIGLFCAATGLLVFVLRSHSKKARVYYWATLTFYITLCITEGVYVLGNNWFSYIPGTLYYLSYSFVAALFLHFSFQYTQTSSGNIERWKLRRVTIPCQRHS